MDQFLFCESVSRFNEQREAGGPPVKPPEREGFGSRLIKQVVAKSLRVDVSMDYRPEGLVFQLTLPTAALEADR